MADTPAADDIIVDIAPEAAVAATPAPSVATPAPAAPPSDSPEVGIEDLRRQLAEKDQEARTAKERAEHEAAARQEAERRAQTASGEAQRAFTAAQQAEYDSIVNALASAEGEIKQIQQDATAALEAGEFAKANELQVKLGRLGSKVERLEDGKAALDARRTAAPDGRTTPAAPRPVALDFSKAWGGDELEAFLHNRTPRTAAWIRQHPQFASDPAFRRKVTGADGYVGDTLGIPRDSDEYFAKIEEVVGLRQQERTDPVPTPATPPPAATPAAAPAAAVPRSPTPAAPPTPSVPSSRPGVGGTRITLTAEEAAHARATLTPDIIGDQDPLVVYARNKQALVTEGKWFGPNGQR